MYVHVMVCTSMHLYVLLTSAVTERRGTSKQERRRRTAIRSTAIYREIAEASQNVWKYFACDWRLVDHDVHKVVAGDQNPTLRLD